MTPEEKEAAIRKLTGLTSPDNWENPARLLEAKARVKVADLHPQQAVALQCIEEALDQIYQGHLRAEREQIVAVGVAFEEWRHAKITTDELWMAIREVVDGPRSEWDY